MRGNKDMMKRDLTFLPSSPGTPRSPVGPAIPYRMRVKQKITEKSLLTGSPGSPLAPGGPGGPLPPGSPGFPLPPGGPCTRIRIKEVLIENKKAHKFSLWSRCSRRAW